MALIDLALWAGLALAAVCLFLGSCRTDCEKVRVAVRLLAFALAVVSVKQLSYASYFGPVGENPGVFWLSSGLQVGVLLLVHRRWYLLFVLTAACSHLLSGQLSLDLHWRINLLWTAATILEAVIGSLLLRWSIGGIPDITRPSTFMLFCVLCVGVASAVCATVGATTIMLVFGETGWFGNWQAWWFSNALGMLSLGPVLLAWNDQCERELPDRRVLRRVELTAMYVLILIVTFMAVGPFRLPTDALWNSPYLVLPLLVWAALRFNARISTGSALFVAIIAVYTANATLTQLPWIGETYYGPFRRIGVDIPSTVLAIQVFLFVTLFTSQLLVVLATQRKRADLAAIEVRNQLYESQRMESISQFAAGVAHDLSNLLMVITLYRDQVEAQLGDKTKLAPALKAMDDAAGTATAMTRSLLDYSRQNHSEVGPILLDELLNRTLQVCRPLLPVKIDITIDIDSSQKLVIEGDANQIQQVILNLVLNARDAMMPGGGRLRIWAKPSENEPGRIEVGVADSGTGIAPQDLKRVTEPFFTTKQQGKGTGLGLSIACGIVGQHGGSMLIDSTRGEGTTVRLLFSRHTTVPHAHSTTPGSILSTTGMEGIMSRVDAISAPRPIVSVLIANEQIRGLAIMELRKQGWDPRQCNSLEEVFDLAKAFANEPAGVFAVIDLQACATPEALTSGSLPVPTVVLYADPPAPKLQHPRSTTLALPFRMQDLINKLDTIR